MTYSEKLQDDRWKQKRAQILARDGFVCQDMECTNQSKKLEVHHIDYIYGTDPWAYPDDMLITLCEVCHNREQGRKKMEKSLINTLKMKGFLMSDLLALSCKIDTDTEFTHSLLKALRNNG